MVPVLSSTARRWFRDPRLPLPRTEVTRFPHAVLEVKLSLPAGQEKPEWVSDLLDSGYLTEVPPLSHGSLRYPLATVCCPMLTVTRILLPGGGGGVGLCHIFVAHFWDLWIFLGWWIRQSNAQHRTALSVQDTWFLDCASC